jgi:hypothetical protein
LSSSENNVGSEPLESAEQLPHPPQLEFLRRQMLRQVARLRKIAAAATIASVIKF